jgi:tRNA threonylcarbamoyladenosine biosynthesis protein TsaB
MLLAVDTSTRMVGLALYDGVQVLYELAWASNDFHTVELAPAVASMLERSGQDVAALQAVAVATGPGSFTGLRIGLALAKGLALVRHIPIIGIPTLDVLAAAQPLMDLPMVAVLRAGRGRLAVGWYAAGTDAAGTDAAGKGSWQSRAPIEVLTPKDLSQRIHTPTLVCGELSEDERRRLGRKRKNVLLASPAQSLRRPGFLAELGWQRLEAGRFDDPVTLSPIYLHYNDPIPE